MALPLDLLQDGHDSLRGPRRGREGRPARTASMWLTVAGTLLYERLLHYAAAVVLLILHIHYYGSLCDPIIQQLLMSAIHSATHWYTAITRQIVQLPD